jgi:hypothetical protein
MPRKPCGGCGKPGPNPLPKGGKVPRPAATPKVGSPKR